MDLNAIAFRAEQEKDLAEIANVTTSAFKQEEEARLIGKVRASTFFVPELSIVAEFQGRIIAHVMLSRIWFRDRNGYLLDVLSLAPVSVLPAYQNQGVGGRLIQHSLSRATELAYPAVILLGHPDYYPRFGFVPTNQFDIVMPPFVTDQSAFMIKVLDDARSPRDGSIVYTPAFVDVC